MLTKANRFRGRSSLKLVFRRGQVTRGGQISLRFLPATGRFRAAVVVSKKTHKSAVVRNRLRRRIYSYLEKHLVELKTGDLVVTVHDASLAEQSAESFKQVFETLLKRAGLLP